MELLRLELVQACPAVAHVDDVQSLVATRLLLSRVRGSALLAHHNMYVFYAGLCW